ncbi:YqeB family protein [Actinomadura welshii]
MRKQADPNPKDDRPAVLREPVWSTVGFYIVAALVGAGAGWLLGLLADWLVTLPYAPMKGPARLVGMIPDTLLPALGAAAGLVVGLIAQYEQLVIRLHTSHLVLTRKGCQQRLSREDIGTVCRDGKELVVLGTDGGELARHECGIDFGRVADTFTEHGYLWADADPYRDDFRLWVPDSPGLYQGANALLKARQKALEGKDTDEDVQMLREELARLGVVVKDEKRRQYVRTIGRPPLTQEQDEEPGQ